MQILSQFFFFKAWILEPVCLPALAIKSLGLRQVTYLFGPQS